MIGLLIVMVMWLVIVWIAAREVRLLRLWRRKRQARALALSLLFNAGVLRRLL